MHLRSSYYGSGSAGPLRQAVAERYWAWESVLFGVRECKPAIIIAGGRCCRRNDDAAVRGSWKVAVAGGVQLAADRVYSVAAGSTVRTKRLGEGE